MEASLLARYHVEELSAYENNSHYWRISFSYTPGSWQLDTALLGWQTVREQLLWALDVDDILFHPEISSQDELLVQLGLGWNYRSVSFRLLARSSLLRGRMEELNFSLSI